MKVSELHAGQGKVDVEVEIKSKAESRVFQKYGKELKVANAIVGDDSGDIALSLWNDDIDKVKVGDKIKITNGYVTEFNGQKQLTSGKYGKMDVLSPSESVASSESSVQRKDTLPLGITKSEKVAAKATKQMPSRDAKDDDGLSGGFDEKILDENVPTENEFEEKEF